MYLERQTQFGDILRLREGSAGVFLDPTQAVAHGVRVANEYLSRAAHRCIVVLPHPKRFKKHLPLLVGKIAKTVQRAPTVWIIAARRVLLPAPDRTLIMGSRTGFDRLQDNGGPYQQRLRAHSTARENRRAARRRDGVSADNPRCRSLSSITSTASAARSTMELLGAEVNRAPGSDPNGLPGVKAHGQFTEAETATCARRQSHSGPPVPSRPQRQPCRFAGGQQTRRDDNIGAVRPRPHSVVEQSTGFHRVP